MIGKSIEFQKCFKHAFVSGILPLLGGIKESSKQFKLPQKSINLNKNIYIYTIHPSLLVESKMYTIFKAGQSSNTTTGCEYANYSLNVLTNII